MAAPVIATSAVGAAALGAISNAAQYVATQWINNESVNGKDLVVNTAIGAVAGQIAGKVTVGNFGWHPTYSDYEAMRTIGYAAANLGPAGAIRSAVASIYGNTDPNKYIPKD